MFNSDNNNQKEGDRSAILYANFNRIQTAALYCMKSFQLLRVFGAQNEQN